MRSLWFEFFFGRFLFLKESVCRSEVGGNLPFIFWEACWTGCAWVLIPCCPCMIGSRLRRQCVCGRVIYVRPVRPDRYVAVSE